MSIALPKMLHFRKTITKYWIVFVIWFNNRNIFDGNLHRNSTKLFCVWLFHILYMWCRQLKLTIDKTIGALETYSIMEYELFFATLPLSWFQILLTVESPAQVLTICALCHTHPAHQTKHSPVLWRKALCTIVEAGLGMGGSEVHRVDNILWKPTW